MKSLRVAFIHDWLLGMRGGERCLEALCRMFPRADIYTAFYNEPRITPGITGRSIEASPFNSLPFVQRYYRYLLPLYPAVARAMGRGLHRRLAARDYDLVISVSHCLAKNVPIPPGVFHLCYCLTPMRYLWDKYDSYFAEHPLEPLIGALVRPLRRWDADCACGVHRFVAISQFVRDRIGRAYGREADVIYPPVEPLWFERPAGVRPEGFLCVSALVPYKNVDVIVRAFNNLPYQLTVVGDGPLRSELQAIARPNIVFRQNISDSELHLLYSKSRALIFGAEEDFGLAPVESQAGGRPVICLGRGGTLETVVGQGDKPTGVYFPEPAPEAVRAAVADFVSREHQFDVDNICQQAQKFSLARFEREFGSLLERLGLGQQERGLRAIGI